MKTKNVVKFIEEGTRENIEVEEGSYSDTDEPAIYITVNAWMDRMGGTDGETVVFSIESFQEFINACQMILDKAKGS
jgi:hypothetical protein